MKNSITLLSFISIASFAAAQSGEAFIVFSGAGGATYGWVGPLDGEATPVDTPFAAQSLEVSAGDYYCLIYGADGFDQPVYPGTTVTVGPPQVISSAQCVG